jgi:hypothetical protein
MSQLQLGLIVTGIVALLVVLAQNYWMVRRNQPRMPDASAGADMANNAFREPTMDHDAFEDSGFALPVVERKPALDALIDVIACIDVDAPVLGEAALAAMPPTRRVGSKLFMIEGLNAVTERWEFPVAGQRYRQLQSGVQLANRSGALNDIEFSEFVVKSQAYADALGGTPDFPEMRQEIARARELDQFAGDHDAQLSFMLRARRAAWSPSYIQQMASKLGFVPGSMAGRMVVPASLAGMPPVLSLNFEVQAALSDDPTQSALREVTLSLDVPQVNRGERPFERMRKAATSLALEMDGLVTDDNEVALPDEAMNVIAAELDLLYDTLEQHELAAGSALARRLFS